MKLLPTGIENFKTMIDKSAYYVDKTNFIEDVLSEQVVSYTRPRRFGTMSRKRTHKIDKF